MFQIDEPGSVQYGLMGTSACMGDHKVKYVYLNLLFIMFLYLLFIYAYFRLFKICF
jgi:hypothetical protein